MSQYVFEIRNALAHYLSIFDLTMSSESLSVFVVPYDIFLNPIWLFGDNVHAFTECECLEDETSYFLNISAQAGLTLSEITIVDINE